MSKSYAILDLVRSGLLIAHHEENKITTYVPNNTNMFILYDDKVHLPHFVKMNAIIAQNHNRIIQWADRTDFIHPYNNEELRIQDPVYNNVLHEMIQ